MLYHQRCSKMLHHHVRCWHSSAQCRRERVGDFEDCGRWVSWLASGHRHCTTTLLLSTTLCQTLYYFLQLCILPLATLLALLLYSLPLYYCHLAFVHLYYDHWSTIFFFTPASTYSGKISTLWSLFIAQCRVKWRRDRELPGDRTTECTNVCNTDTL